MDANKSKPKSLRDLYYEALEQDPPHLVLLDDLAEVTHKTRATVRGWIYGYAQPDYSAKTLIAAHLGMSIEELFPGTNSGTK